MPKSPFHPRWNPTPRDKTSIFFGLCIFLFCMSFSIAHAAVSIEFARHISPSPKGDTVAFSWKGDIWRAKILKKGISQARRLTSHLGYDAHPIWSPNGKKIAFAARRHVNYDIYVMDATGGTPKRLSYHQSHEYPLFWSSDSRSLIFHSQRARGNVRNQWLYQIPVSGGMPRVYLALQNVGASLSPNNRYLAFVRGGRRWWRKYSKMPMHPRVWLFDLKKRTFTRITPEGFSADSVSWLSASQLVYRSEKSGHFNVWSYDLKTKKHKALTHFKWGAVRFPKANISTKSVVFAHFDALYRLTLQKKGKPVLQKLAFSGIGDHTRYQIQRKVMSKGVREFQISPNGKEMALIINGDVYVRKIKGAQWMRRVTSSAWRERHLAWSPDGRSLAFTSDKGGQAAIYIAKAGSTKAGKRKGKPILLSNTMQPKVIRWSPANVKYTEKWPKWSPDGKRLAFIQGPGNLCTRPSSPKAKGFAKERLISGSWNIDKYQWSPDGRWFLFSRMDAQSNHDIFLVRSNGKGNSYNISRHPDDDASPVWSANGRVLAFLTRGIHNKMQIRYAFLRKSDHERDRQMMRKAFKFWSKRWKKQLKRKWMAKKRRKKAAKKAAPTTQRAIKPKKHKKAKKKRLRVQLKGLAFRLRTIGGLPGNRGPASILISPSGNSYILNVRGKLGGIYRIKWNGKGLKRIARGRFGKMQLTEKGQLFALRRGGTLVHISLKAPKPPRAIRFRAEIFTHRGLARLQKFEEAWSLIQRWFYDPKFHGINWKKMRVRYRKLVKKAQSDEDFDDAVRLMLGELNASHMGIYTPYRGAKTTSGNIGVQFRIPPLFSKAYKSQKGLQVNYIRPKSPASKRRSRIRRGDWLLAINGHKVSPRVNINKYLRWKTNRVIALKIKRRSGKIKQIRLTPVSYRQAVTQRYKAWVKRTRRKVHRLSGGLLAYAHIRSMSLRYLAQFERDLFAHAHGKVGLVLDVRNNGGGWITDMLLAMFYPKPHAYTHWKGAHKLGYPTIRRPLYTWHKPIILLCNQRSVSNAEIFSHAFKNLKLGTLVGMPTYGGVISTRWMRLMDGTYFGVPLRGWWTLPHKKNMENGPAVPNVIVPHTPKDELQRKDKQLQRAIRILLKQIANPKKKK